MSLQHEACANWGFFLVSRRVVLYFLILVRLLIDLKIWDIMAGGQPKDKGPTNGEGQEPCEPAQ